MTEDELKKQHAIVQAKRAATALSEAMYNCSCLDIAVDMEIAHLNDPNCPEKLWVKQPFGLNLEFTTKK